MKCPICKNPLTNRMCNVWGRHSYTINKPRGIHIKKLIYLFADKTACYVLKNNEFTGSKPVTIDAVFNTQKNTDDINIFKK